MVVFVKDCIQQIQVLQQKVKADLESWNLEMIGSSHNVWHKSRL